MSTQLQESRAPGAKIEPVLAQGTVEKVFPAEEACTERANLAKVIGWQGADDGGFALKRGILAGSLAEHELIRLASDEGFSLNLGQVADRLMSRTRFGALSKDHVNELRNDAIEWVRQWQENFPPIDGELDWGEVRSLLPAQTDLFLWRPQKFRIRVRPDAIVGVGDTLVAVEFSTSQSPDWISPARFALNHHALLREQRRHPEWSQYRNVATRVEMLRVGEGFTVRMSTEEADRWRIAIGVAVEKLLTENYDTNVGPWCTTCPWLAHCQFRDDEPSGGAF